MTKSRKLLFWIFWYILSLASLIIDFPIMLFALYPYSVIAVSVYAIALIVLSVLSFRKNAVENTNVKKVLFGMLLLPIVALLIILVSIETGLLHYPG